MLLFVLVMESIVFCEIYLSRAFSFQSLFHLNFLGLELLLMVVSTALTKKIKIFVKKLIYKKYVMFLQPKKLKFYLNLTEVRVVYWLTRKTHCQK